MELSVAGTMHVRVGGEPAGGYFTVNVAFMPAAS